LTNNNNKKPYTFSKYIFSADAKWFWLLIVAALVTSIIVISGVDGNSSLIYARYTMGLIYVLFLPGYAMVKILFPAKQLDFFEMLVLSIGLSLAIVPLIVLPLNFTPIGLTVSSVTTSILILTLIFSTLAALRGFQTIK
jgi:uncharacterized membrane protein